MRKWSIVATCVFMPLVSVVSAGSLALAQAPSSRMAPASSATSPSPDSGSDLSIELIDPKVLRVCADPRNMPLSNQQEQGFENKLARLLADRLGKSISYTWYPGATGFVRNTLGSYRCDLIMGYPQGNDLVQSTNPYYRTAYALVFKPGNGLDGVERLDDLRLNGKHIGIVAGTPPANVMARLGMMAQAKSYRLVVDTRFDSSIEEMIKDIADGVIDAGVMWGPMAGYYAKRGEPALTMVPLVHETSGPRMVYRIGMGVRFSDQEWKRMLNRLIQDLQPDINKILLDYGVPLLDDQDQPITVSGAAPRP